MPSVTTRFPPPLHERFLQECERRDISPSDFIRKAVEAMMDHIDTPSSARASADDWEVPMDIVIRPDIPANTVLRQGSPKDGPEGMRGVRGIAMDGSKIEPRRATPKAEKGKRK